MADKVIKLKANVDAKTLAVTYDGNQRNQVVKEILSYLNDDYIHPITKQLNENPVQISTAKVQIQDQVITPGMSKKGIGDIFEYALSQALLDKFKRYHINDPGISGSLNNIHFTKTPAMLSFELLASGVSPRGNIADVMVAKSLINHAQEDGLRSADLLWANGLNRKIANVKKSIQILWGEKINGKSTELGFGDIKLVLDNNELIIVECKNYRFDTYERFGGFHYFKFSDDEGNFPDTFYNHIKTYGPWRTLPAWGCLEPDRWVNQVLTYGFYHFIDSAATGVESDKAYRYLSYFLQKANKYTATNYANTYLNPSVTKATRAFVGVLRIAKEKGIDKISYGVDVEAIARQLDANKQLNYKVTEGLMTFLAKTEHGDEKVADFKISDDSVKTIKKAAQGNSVQKPWVTHFEFGITKNLFEQSI